MSYAEELRYITSACLGGFIVLSMIVNYLRRVPRSELLWRIGLWIFLGGIIYSSARAGIRRTPVDLLTWIIMLSSVIMVVGAIWVRSEQARLRNNRHKKGMSNGTDSVRVRRHRGLR